MIQAALFSTRKPGDEGDFRLVSEVEGLENLGRLNVAVYDGGRRADLSSPCSSAARSSASADNPRSAGKSAAP